MWSRFELRLRSVECGINLIIGNHPDYIQPVSYVKTKNGNCGLVFFSLGQFIGDGNSRLGALARMLLLKEKKKLMFRVIVYDLLLIIRLNLIIILFIDYLNIRKKWRD